ncbi:MAG TPA: PilZ domain-containing protein [Polyangiaceae bacterium]|nr:PilZ domain-containing protein [Polyangiaceae bacterium]
MAGLTVLGHFDGRDLRAIQEAAGELGLEMNQVPVADAARDWVTSARPDVILVQAEDPRALTLSARLRLDPRLVGLPMLGVHVEPRALAFALSLNLGLDDLVQAGQAHALVVRVREALRATSVIPPASRGRAVVLEPDELRRAALERALKAAGYDVRFVDSSLELEALDLDQSISMLAVSGVSVEVAELLARRRPSPEVPFVLSLDGREEAAARRALAALPRLRTLDLDAPPENVIFLVNELENPQLVNKRASPRELYGEAVRFRVAGQDQEEVGYTYNVSTEGMFVRTLAPPTQAEIWLELNAPRSMRCVRLEGSVMWRRPFRTTQRAVVPPGFGVKITDGSRRDLLLWIEGCGLPPSSLGLKAQPGS